MPHPVRAMYLFLQMPQNTFLALAIYSASAPLYAHYANLGPRWGPTPLDDQQLAGGLMWIVGDLVFVAAIVLVVAGWMRSEERDAVPESRADARWPRSASAKGSWPTGWPASARRVRRRARADRAPTGRQPGSAPRGSAR